ncbi:hypothetical protein RFI_29691, partial [Reticulomyxa filosa]
MIALLNQEKIAVIFTYIPPYSNSYEARIDDIYKDICTRMDILDNLGYRIVIMGDFNARIKDTGDTITNENGKRLLSFCNVHSLKILNLTHAYKKYTYYRIMEDKRIGTILDYALVKQDDFWENSDTQLCMTVIEEYVESDHFPIKITFKVPQKHVDTSSSNEGCPLGRLSIARDYNSLQNVSTHFADQCAKIKLYDTICDTNNNVHYNAKDNTTRVYDTFMYWLYETIWKCKAYTYRVIRANESQHSNLPEELNNVLQEINTFIQDIDHTKQRKFNRLIEKYNELKKVYLQQQVNIALNQVENAFKGKEDKRLYCLLSKIGERPCHPLHDEDGTPIHTDEGKCRLLTKHYKAIFQKHSDIPKEHETYIMSKLEQYDKQSKSESNTPWTEPFTEDEVCSTINSMKRNKAVFLDCLPNELWKSLVKENSRILTIFINNISIAHQQLPPKLMLSKMTSIPKTNIPYDCDSMRGIRIKSSCLTIIDKLILKRCQPMIDRYLHPEQGGFRAGRGVDDQIICLRILLSHQDITKKETFICTIDLKKAFDNVWIPGLLTKLYECGITGHIYQVIKRIFEDSKIIIENNGLCDNEIVLERGTGQGFSTSAPFFNVYINDIIQDIRQINSPITVYGIPLTCLFYADDILLVGKNKSDINKKIKLVRDYCTKWGLKMNEAKCTLS